MAKQPNFWSVEERLAAISADGDPLEAPDAVVDFERFRPILERAAGKPKGAKGGRPAFDVLPEFRMLVLRSRHGLSLGATGKAVRDRPGWMRFCGLGIADKAPDANTLWDFREALINAGELDALFAALERMISAAGFISRTGRMLDSSPVAAPRQRTGAGEKAAIKEGRTAREIRPGEPAKAARKDTDARWTVKPGKAKARPDGTKPVDIAIPVFGCKSHIGVDRRNGIIRRRTVTDAAAHDGARLREGLVDTANAGREVWADTDCRSERNEAWLEANGMASRIHRRKPRGRPAGERDAKDNGRKSAVRAKAGHVFAHRKSRMGLTIRTIGIARARAAITLANMAAT